MKASPQRTIRDDGTRLSADNIKKLLNFKPIKITDQQALNDTASKLTADITQNDIGATASLRQSHFNATSPKAMKIDL